LSLLQAGASSTVKTPTAQVPALLAKSRPRYSSVHADPSRETMIRRHRTSLAYAVAPPEDEWVPVSPRETPNRSGTGRRIEEQDRKARVPRAAFLPFGVELPQDLYSDEVYGEGGLVEQANWFLDRPLVPDAVIPSTSSWDGSLKNRHQASSAVFSRQSIANRDAVEPVLPKLEARRVPHAKSSMTREIDYAEQKRLMDMLAIPPTVVSPMQAHLRDLFYASRLPGDSGRAFRDLYDVIEAAEPSMAVWQHLATHLRMSFTRWQRRPKNRLTVDPQICHILVYLKLDRLDKAINLASELLRNKSHKKDTAEVIPFSATLTRHCVEAGQSEYVTRLVAARYDGFAPCFSSNQLRDSKAVGLAYRSLRESMSIAFTSIKEVDDWVREQHEKNMRELGAGPLFDHRMLRLSVAAILACLSVSSVNMAYRFYRAFVDCQIEVPLEASSRLWEALAQQGSVAQAWEIFDISGGSKILDNQHALPNRKVLSRVLDLAQVRGDVMLAQATFGLIASGTATPSTRDVTAILRAQANAGRTKDVDHTLRRHFGGTVSRLAAQRKSDRNAGSSSLSQRRQELNALETLVRAHAAAGHVTEAELWWERLRAKCDSPLCEDYNVMLHLHSRRGDLWKCQQLLEDMARCKVKPNAITYTTMMGAYTSKKDYRSAAAMLNRMRDEDVVMDTIAIGSVLNVAIEAGKWTGVKEIYETLEPDTQSDPAIAGTMLKAMLLLGAPFDSVKQLFQETFPDAKYASSRAWSILIQSACDAGQVAKAQLVLNDMLTKAENNSRPNPYAFTILVAAHLRNGDLESAKHIFSRMDDLRIPLTSVGYSLMLRMLLKDGSINKDSVHRFAEDLLVSRPWRLVDNHGRGRDTENILTPVILEASAAGNTRRVEEYTRKLAHRGELPSLTMSTILMDTYRKAGQIEKMQMVWNHIHQLARQARQSEDSSSPSNLLCIPLSIYLDGLTTACRHQEVFDVWQSLAAEGFGFDAQNWNHLAVAFVRSGRPEEAFEVVENVLLTRAEEVAKRRSPAHRDPALSIGDATKSLSRQSVSSLPLPGEFEDEAVMRPPNRRHQYRSHTEDMEEQTPIKETVSNIVTKWRPSDLSWQASFLTVAVLERAYAKLENNIPVMALLSGEEEEIEPQRQSDADGTMQKATPLVLLARLNHRYARTVSLIMLHRRKRRSQARRKVERAKAAGSGSTA
jgi:pentatricopeptide repeat protein